IPTMAKSSSARPIQRVRTRSGPPRWSSLCKDDYGEVSKCDATVKVIDDNPLEVETKKSLGNIWPPNHKYHQFSVYDCLESVNEVCGDHDDDGYYGKGKGKDKDKDVELELMRVISDEDELAKGSGSTCDDIVLG